MIETFEIAQKVKGNPTLFASESDFVLHNARIADSEFIVQNPNVTLYSINSGTQKAIFVETPDCIDLLSFPFLYQAQYEYAQRVSTVSFEELHTIAEGIELKDNPVYLIHSVGRCGSTLMSNAFQEIPGLASLSEPDVFTNIVGVDNMHTQQQLVADSAKLLLSKFEANLAWAIKCRSFCMEIADITQDTIPHSKTLFLYRNIGDWARSSARAFQIYDPSSTEWMNSEDPVRSKMIPLLLADPERSYTDYAPAEFITLMWLSSMQRFIELSERGYDIIAIQYEDLITNPKEVLSRTLSRMGLNTSFAEGSLAAFAKDSQQGSVLSKSRTGSVDVLSSSNYDEIRSVLSRFSYLRESKFVADSVFDI